MIIKVGVIMSGNKINKDTIPEGFTMSLALVDAMPVLFFGASMVVASVLLHSYLFLVGAILCLYAGAAKVLWKIIVVLRRKNIWWLFLQMRIVMPIGMLLMLLGIIFNQSHVSLASFKAGFLSFPSVIFFLIGILGMCMMMVFAFRLDSSDVRSNWIEQLTNGIAQAAIFVGLGLLNH